RNTIAIAMNAPSALIDRRLRPRAISAPRSPIDPAATRLACAIQKTVLVEAPAYTVSYRHGLSARPTSMRMSVPGPAPEAAYARYGRRPRVSRPTSRTVFRRGTGLRPVGAAGLLIVSVNQSGSAPH